MIVKSEKQRTTFCVSNAFLEASITTKKNCHI